MNGKRTLYEIYWEILTYCRNPRTFTGIVHRCSLNSDIAQEHIEFLLKRGFIRKYEEDGGNLYSTTEKAKVFLDSFREMYMGLYLRGPEFKL
jgi:predicted transcriptional regulator